MREDVELLRIEIDAAGLIANKRIVGPTVPQPRHHRMEFPRAGITGGVGEMLVAAEVVRGFGVAGGDHVPPRAPLAQVIERGEAASDVERLVISGAGGGDQTDPAGRPGQRREQRERFERGDRMAALQRVGRHVQHRQVIGHEERIETRGLQPLRQPPDQREVEIGVGHRTRIAPRAGVDRDRAHERAEVELTCLAHGGVSVRGEGAGCRRRARCR